MSPAAHQLLWCRARWERCALLGRIGDGEHSAYAQYWQGQCRALADLLIGGAA